VPRHAPDSDYAELKLPSKPRFCDPAAGRPAAPSYFGGGGAVHQLRRSGALAPTACAPWCRRSALELHADGNAVFRPSPLTVHLHRRFPSAPAPPSATDHFEYSGRPPPPVWASAHPSLGRIRAHSFRHAAWCSVLLGLGGEPPAFPKCSEDNWSASRTRPRGLGTANGNQSALGDILSRPPVGGHPSSGGLLRAHFGLGGSAVLVFWCAGVLAVVVALVACCRAWVAARRYAASANDSPTPVR